MSEFVVTQILDFFTMVFIGCLISMCYNIIRFVRIFVHHNTIAKNTEDVLYSIIVGIGVVFYMFYNEIYVARAYVFGGMAVGYVICRKIGSKLLINVLKKYKKSYKIKRSRFNTQG